MKFVVGERNIKNKLLAKPEKALPQLYITLGLKKQFFKVMDNERDCFKYLLV